MVPSAHGHNAQSPRKTFRESGGRPRPVQPSAAYQHRAKRLAVLRLSNPLSLRRVLHQLPTPGSMYWCCPIMVVAVHQTLCPSTTSSEHRPAGAGGWPSPALPSRSPTAWIPVHHTHLCDRPAPAHRFNASPLSSSLVASTPGTTPMRTDAQANGPPLPCSGHRSGRLPPPRLSTCGTLPVSGV